MDIISSGVAKLIHYSEKEFISLTFEELPETSTLKKYSCLLLDMLATNKTSKILVDSSKVTAVKINDILWLVERISPVIKNYNIDKIAFINPQSMLGQVSLKLMLKLSKCNDTEVFKELDEANAWLFNSQSKSA